MGFLKSLLRKRPSPGTIPAGEVHTPWQGPGKRKVHDDPQSGTSKRPHRGLALENRSAPNLTAENQAHWIGLPEGWAREFVYANQPLHVHSSNVDWAQYWLDSQELYVKFLSGHGGTYEGVTEQEAVDFTQAGSKGGWVIDVMIGRSNLIGHACWTVNGGKSIKPYRPDYMPAARALIPAGEITPIGESPVQIPDREIVIESEIRAGHEDLFRDNLRRQGVLSEDADTLETLNQQRKAQREFNRRLLGG